MIESEDPPSENGQRNLVAFSKLLQNQANGTQFKEDHMRPFNDLIEQHAQTYERFLDAVLAKGEVA